LTTTLQGIFPSELAKAELKGIRKFQLRTVLAFIKVGGFG